MYLCKGSYKIKKMFDIPILFIIFNRLDTTQRVFDMIKSIQPQRLYVACDGARPERVGEAAACSQTQNIINQIDWDCELFTYFLDENIGSSQGPYTFIKWFFAHETKGIVLEHDCLPHPDFFGFCRTMLNKYEHDLTIGTIAGTNFNAKDTDSSSYYLSAYNHLWGWATWKRTIDLYDIALSNYTEAKLPAVLDLYFDRHAERFYWKTIFWQIKRKQIQTWDYHLTFACWFNRLYAVVPTRNLISNIGFGAGAIHTVDTNSPMANVPTHSILPLQELPMLKVNKIAETAYFKTVILDNKSEYYLYLKLYLKRLGVFNSLLAFKRRLISIAKR